MPAQLCEATDYKLKKKLTRISLFPIQMIPQLN